MDEATKAALGEISTGDLERELFSRRKAELLDAIERIEGAVLSQHYSIGLPCCLAMLQDMTAEVRQLVERLSKV